GRPPGLAHRLPRRVRVRSRDRDAPRAAAGPDRRALGGDPRLMRYVRMVWPLPALLVLVVAAAEIAYATGGSVTQGVVVVGLIDVILVVGLYMFVGTSGVFSFGSIAFASIGAYTAALMVIPPDQKAILQPLLPKFIAHAHMGPIAATLLGGAVAAA